MNEMKNYKNLKKLLRQYRQEHLLAFFDQLKNEQKTHLLTQIQQLDLAQLDKYVTDFTKKPSSVEKSQRKISPAAHYKAEVSDTALKRKYAQAAQQGREIISRGIVAAFVVAGGQGTRLGFNEPKGNFPISPVKNKTLFQIFAETIASVGNKYNIVCPWYIMTSPLNYAQTVDIFEKNRYFSLNKEDIIIFQQGTLPSFSTDGKILLADRDTISCSPDGHGGSLKALNKSGALSDMKNRGVEIISYWQIDNPLVNIMDPLFIGLHNLDNAEMSSKAVLKTQPTEKVGNFCLLDDRVSVIEYTELPRQMAQQQKSDGSLVFELASIAVHLLNCSFVEKFSAQDRQLPLHKAIKNIEHIDETGKKVTSKGIKLESFIFDALPLAEKSIILQTPRSEEFAPVKNAAGPDSVETCRQMMLERAADWLSSIGLSVPRKDDGSPDCEIEIAPGFALEKEDLLQKRNLIPKINPGDKIYLA